MKASLEISMYPLDKNYGTSILKFIDRLNQYPELKIISNTMSTQIFGEYDELMAIITKEIKISFTEEPTVLMAMKLANLDLRP